MISSSNGNNITPNLVVFKVSIKIFKLSVIDWSLYGHLIRQNISEFFSAGKHLVFKELGLS